MERDNKEEINIATAKELLLAHMQTINYGWEEPWKIWISDVVQFGEWGYYFLAGPYKAGEAQDSHSLKVYVNKYTGEVCMAACVM